MEVTEDEIVKEVRLAGDIKGEINALLISLTNLLINKTEDPTSNSGFQCNDESTSLHMKLPKLETKKFSGKKEEWQEFWDSFESTNHTNMKLSSVEKFFYLRGLLLGGARTSSQDWMSHQRIMRPKTTIQKEDHHRKNAH